MAVTATHLTTSSDTSDLTSYTTASISPSKLKIVLVAVGTDGGGVVSVNTPTISGASMSWTLVGTVTDAGGTRKISLFRGLSGNPGSGALTIDFSGQTQEGCYWTISEFGNVDTSGSNGAGAIVQSASNFNGSGTTLAVTLGAFSSTSNATFGAMWKNGTSSITTGSGFTQLGQVNPERSIQSQWRSDNDTICDWAWSSNQTAVGFAVELKENLYPIFGGMI